MLLASPASYFSMLLALGEVCAGSLALEVASLAQHWVKHHDTNMLGQSDQRALVLLAALASARFAAYVLQQLVATSGTMNRTQAD